MARSTSRTSRLTQLPEPEQEGRPLDSPLIGSSPVPTIQPPARRSFSREYENIAQEIRDQLHSISPDHGGDTEPEDQDPTERYKDMAQEIRNQLDFFSVEHNDQTDKPEEQANISDGHGDTPDEDDNISNDNHHATEVGYSGQEEPKNESNPELDIHVAQDLPYDEHEEDRNPAEEHPSDQDRALMPPDRPPTAASTDTYQQARMLFQDFDGVHYAPSVRARDEDVEDDDVPSLRNHPLVRDLPRPQSYVQPPPEDGMVFYPAPVPRTLNLPKRLSQLPAAAMQAKRQSQVLGSLPADVRKSAAWLPQPESAGDNIPERPISQDTNPRHSNPQTDLAGLPPQLRASAYFDHPSVSQDVEVKGESAVATLDSILEASATAPVGAFTNHPISGATGQEVFSREKARKSTTSITGKVSTEKKKNRSTLDLLLGRRKSSGDPKQIMQKQNGSKLSLGTQLNEMETEEGQEREEGMADDEEEEEQEEEQFFGPPSTLLAELQLRKHQQKQRNRTAATAFPNGMHSTLLELDAVAQIEKKRRMAQRPALAWEDSEARAAENGEVDDDDVPLGMLFPGRDGLVNKGKGQSDWDRPLGLIEQRDLEESEPLSRRRNRLRGVSPNKRDPSPGKRVTGMPIKEEAPPVQPPEPENADDEDEPLADRLRRLKNRETLNAAIGDNAQRPLSSNFASEIMSQFGGLEDRKDQPPGTDEEEETLGQRRKRLQAEALAAGTSAPQSRNVSGGSAPLGQAASRPSLKPTRSLADLLSANPAGSRQVSAEQAKSAPLPGSLLHKNESRQERRKTKMMEQNRKGMAEGLNAPLVDVPQEPSQPHTQISQGFAGGMYNNGAGGAVSTPGFGYGSALQSPTAGVGAGSMGMGMGMMSAPMAMGVPGMATTPMSMMGVGVGYQANMNGYGYFNNMAAQNHPLGYSTFQHPIGGSMGMGMGMNAGLGMPSLGVQYGGYGQNNAMAAGTGPDMEGISPKQREMIDRWRQSIA